VDEPTLYPRYKVGDLVRCLHVYYNYHYYYGWKYDQESESDEYFYGIVIDVDYACWDGYEDDFEIIYIIYCTDGVKRFFSEDEVQKLS
tara:strand:+ start:896 stop:1159 length:264 start_codon:yes stop_codon:yes gene_type:complete